MKKCGNPPPISIKSMYSLFVICFFSVSFHPFTGMGLGILTMVDTDLQTDKGTWISNERLRWATLFNVPMKKELPPNFPPMTLSIMRGLCALTILHPGKEGQGILTKCLDRLFEAYWVEHRKTYEKDVLVEVLNEVLGTEECEKGSSLLTLFLVECSSSFQCIDFELLTYYWWNNSPCNGYKRRQRAPNQELRSSFWRWCFRSTLVRGYEFEGSDRELLGRGPYGPVGASFGDREAEDGRLEGFALEWDLWVWDVSL